MENEKAWREDTGKNGRDAQVSRNKDTVKSWAKRSPKMIREDDYSILREHCCFKGCRWCFSRFGVVDDRHHIVWRELFYAGLAEVRAHVRTKVTPAQRPIKGYSRTPYVVHAEASLLYSATKLLLLLLNLIYTLHSPHLIDLFTRSFACVIGFGAHSLAPCDAPATAEASSLAMPIL